MTVSMPFPYSSEFSCGCDEAVEGNFFHLPGAPVFQLDRAIVQTFCSHDNSNRHAKQIGVLELHTRAHRFTVIIENFKTRLLELAFDTFGSGRDSRILRVEAEQMHMERRNGPGPDDSIRIMALFNNGSHGAGNTDAIA